MTLRMRALCLLVLIAGVCGMSVYHDHMITPLVRGSVGNDMCEGITLAFSLGWISGGFDPFVDCDWCTVGSQSTMNQLVHGCFDPTSRIFLATRDLAWGRSTSGKQGYQAFGNAKEEAARLEDPGDENVEGMMMLPVAAWIRDGVVHARGERNFDPPHAPQMEMTLPDDLDDILMSRGPQVFPLRMHTMSGNAVELVHPLDNATYPWAPFIEQELEQGIRDDLRGAFVGTVNYTGNGTSLMDTFAWYVHGMNAVSQQSIINATSLHFEDTVTITAMQRTACRSDGQYSHFWDLPPLRDSDIGHELNRETLRAKLNSNLPSVQASAPLTGFPYNALEYHAVKQVDSCRGSSVLTGRSHPNVVMAQLQTRVSPLTEAVEPVALWLAVEAHFPTAPIVPSANKQYMMLKVPVPFQNSDFFAFATDDDDQLAQLYINMAERHRKEGLVPTGAAETHDEAKLNLRMWRSLYAKTNLLAYNMHFVYGRPLELAPVLGFKQFWAMAEPQLSGDGGVPDLSQLVHLLPKKPLSVAFSSTHMYVGQEKALISVYPLDSPSDAMDIDIGAGDYLALAVAEENGQVQRIYAGTNIGLGVSFDADFNIRALLFGVNERFTQIALDIPHAQVYYSSADVTSADPSLEVNGWVDTFYNTDSGASATHNFPEFNNAEALVTGRLRRLDADLNQVAVLELDHSLAQDDDWPWLNTTSWAPTGTPLIFDDTFELGNEFLLHTVQGREHVNLEFVSRRYPPSYRAAITPGSELESRLQRSAAAYMVSVAVADCRSYTNCGDCMGDQVYCGWCDRTSECLPLIESEGEYCLATGSTVYYADDGPGSATCPEVTSISPDPMVSHKDQSLTVTVTGEFLPVGTYECGWGDEAYVMPAVLTGLDTLTCPTPTVATAEQLSFDVLYTPSVGETMQRRPYRGLNGQKTWRFYECDAAATTCDECVVLGGPECVWCLEDESAPGTEDQACVRAGTTCDDLEVASECPVVVSAAPGGGATSSSTPVTLDIGIEMTAPQLSNTECVFGSSVVSATAGTAATEVTCIAPAQAEGQSSLRVLYNGFNLTEPIAFPYADCSDQPTCGQCSAETVNDACNWCLASNRCDYTSSCSSAVLTDASQCMSILSGSPLTGPSTGGTVVEIVIEPALLDETYLYQCAFGQMRVSADVIASNALSCRSPATENAASSDAVALDVLLNDRSIVDGTSTLEFLYVGSGFDFMSPEFLGGAGGGSLLLLGAMVLLLRRRKTEDVLAGAKIEKPKNFAPMAFERQLATKRAYKPAYLLLMKSIEDAFFGTHAHDNGFIALHSLYSCLSVTELDNTSRVVMTLAEFNIKSISVLKTFIASEIQAAKAEGSASAMFRSTSVVSNLWKTFSRIHGLEFVWDALAFTINEMQVIAMRAEEGSTKVEVESQTSGKKTKSKSSKTKMRRHKSMQVDDDSLLTTKLELDPTKLKAGESAATNQLQLQLIAQRVFSSIVGSLDKVPVPMLQFFGEVGTAVAAAFPGSENRAVGNFFFTRFICPIVSAPHLYGILAEAPSDALSRQLILVAKSLQNLANDVEFGAKEQYMLSMNSFITGNRSAMQKFLSGVMYHPRRADSYPKVDVPALAHDTSVAGLHRVLLSKKEQLLADLPKRKGGKPLATQISSVLVKVGNHPDDQT